MTTTRVKINSDTLLTTIVSICVSDVTDVRVAIFIESPAKEINKLTDSTNVRLVRSYEK